jgi:hypothetical protein
MRIKYGCGTKYDYKVIRVIRCTTDSNRMMSGHEEPVVDEEAERLQRLKEQEEQSSELILQIDL